MERPEEHARVRPLSPENDERSVSDARRMPGISVAVAAGSVVLALVLVVFGAGGGDEPPSSEPREAFVAADVSGLEVTTSTLPPRLSELLPVDMERLSVVAGADDPRTLLWGPSERFARSYRLPFDPREAWFDTTGNSIAFIDARGALFVGPAPGEGAVQVEAVASAARFHPTDAAELAYTGDSTGAGPVGLYRVRAEPGLLGGIEPMLITELPATARLLTWGDWGYAIALDTPAAILVLDPDGLPRRVMAGTAYAAGGDAILVDSTDSTASDREAVATLAPIVAGSEPAVGIVDSNFEPIFLFPGASAQNSNVTISSDGLRIAVTTFTNTAGTSVTIRDRSESTLRTVRIDAVVQPVDFVAGGSYLALRDADSHELLVVDWRTGARYWVAGLPGDIVAIHF